MKKIKKIIYLLLATSIIFLNVGINSSFATTTKTTQKTVSQQILNVSPLEIVNHPAKYLNKTVSFTAEFVSFTALGLDYKPAFRDGTKYIGVLIKRPDVQDHTIPLSEMKLFVNRDLAEKNALDIEAGDKIKITASVFSNALGDPWLEAKTFNVIHQKK
jgi:hypothetical protein